VAVAVVLGFQSSVVTAEFSAGAAAGVTQLAAAALAATAAVVVGVGLPAAQLAEQVAAVTLLLSGD
jgi:hypothetical protein